MLVISLELLEAVKPVLEKVVRAWLVEGASEAEIQAILPKS